MVRGIEWKDPGSRHALLGAVGEGAGRRGWPTSATGAKLFPFSWYQQSDPNSSNSCGPGEGS